MTLVLHIHLQGQRQLSSQRPAAPTLRSSTYTTQQRRAAAVCNAAPTSRLSGVELAPPDPILGVSEAFKASTSPNKLNLGVGAYRTEELQPYVLEVVKEVRTHMSAPACRSIGILEVAAARGE